MLEAATAVVADDGDRAVRSREIVRRAELGKRER